MRMKAGEQAGFGLLLRALGGEPARLGDTLYCTAPTAGLRLSGRLTGCAIVCPAEAAPGGEELRLLACPNAGGAGTAEEVRGMDGLQELYRLYTACGMELPAFDQFYVELFHRLKAGSARLRCLREAGAVTAAAGTLFESRDAALLWGVAVQPGLQGRGLGRQVVLALCRELLREGRKPLVLCAPGTAGFYRALGFEGEERLRRISPDARHA